MSSTDAPSQSTPVLHHRDVESERDGSEGRSGACPIQVPYVWRAPALDAQLADVVLRMALRGMATRVARERLTGWKARSAAAQAVC